MLRVTDPQLENLMFLRDVTIPWMRENPGRVDFELFESGCGTYRCLLGWYVKQRHAVSMRDNTPWSDVLGCVREEFGDWTYGHLFAAAAGTLDDRARYLDELIAQRLVALEAR